MARVRGIGLGMLALVSLSCARRDLDVPRGGQFLDEGDSGMAVVSQPAPSVSEPRTTPAVPISGGIDSPDAAPPMDPPPDASPPEDPWMACWAFQEGTPACDACTRYNYVLDSRDRDRVGCCRFADPNDVRLCLNVVTCIQANASSCDSGGDPITCFCGTGGDLCFAAMGAANGPCAAEVLAAAKSTVPMHVREQFVDGQSPLGGAVNLTICQEVFCSQECGLGSTGGTGAGGASGTGGSGGAGGAGGAAGTTGAGGASGTGGGAGTGGAACVDQTVDGPICTAWTQRECSPAGEGGCCGLPTEQLRGLCANVLDCFEANAPACTHDANPNDCYCGTSGSRCFLDPGVANGPCVAQVQAAANSTEPGVIELRWNNYGQALGRAVGLSSCRGGLCAAECPHSD